MDDLEPAAGPIDDPLEIDPDDETWRAFDASVRLAASDVLRQTGPASVQHLTDRLREAGDLDRLLDEGYVDDDLTEAVDDILSGTDEFLHSVDDLIAHAGKTLDGLVLTHRVTQSELERDVLDITPDLGMIDWDRHDGLPLAGGGQVHTVYPSDDDPSHPIADDQGSLTGPSGWLDAVTAGGLVALRRRGEAPDIVLTRLDEDDTEAHENLASSRPAIALAAAFERQTRGDDESGSEPVWMVMDALLHDPSLFRQPGPPLADLLEALGLERKGGWVGRRGVAWEPPGVRRNRIDMERLYRRYQFDRCCIAAFEAARDAWSQELFRAADVAHRKPNIEPRAAAKALAHGAVAPALADHLFGMFPDGNEMIDAFAASLAAAAPERSAAPAHWLRGTNAERQGRVVDAEAAFTAAIRCDPEFQAAHLELAGFASDRGDAARALSHLAKAGAPADDPLVQHLRALVPDTAGVGRNDPCPCGSGRKFKSCHLRGGAPLPIESRAGWLVHKVGEFVVSTQHRGPLFGLASTAVEAMHDDDDLDEPSFVEELSRLVGDPFLETVAAHEGGGLAAFIVRRGELLPHDELELAETWFEQRRRLWEVTAADRGSTLTLRDTASGDSFVVSEHLGSTDVAVGQYLLAVVVPVGAQHQMLGAVLDIPLRLRSSVLTLLDVDPSADEIADWYGWSLRPPELVNREGEPTQLRMGRATPATPWREFALALDRHFDRSGHDEEHHWVEHHQLSAEPGDESAQSDEVPSIGEVIVRAFLRRDGDDLLIDTNSDVRWDRVVAILESVDADITVTEILPASDADIGAWTDRAPLGAGSSPELDEILAAHLLAKETEWLDESVPALGGITPRQAAEDPTRREDLIALLRSFDAIDLPAGSASFDPDRIRRTLRLDPES